ncbi:nth-like DNA glycosylase 1 [Haematobia irritans]|uniref:nth-like DNA glycosylase 1 n=1 Tax=Haematobia irritans TaxID=7368 RepID=UPI003F4F70F3
MFRQFILSFGRNMSTTNKKAKETLAKKLSAKKVPVKRELELKPEFFTEVKNNKRTRLATGKKEDILVSAKHEIKNPKKEVTKSKRVSRKNDPKTDLKDVPLEVIPIQENIVIKNENLDEQKATTSSSALLKNENPKQTKIKKEKIRDDNIKSETNEELPVDKWEPANWKEILENIRIMRCKDNAPVDTMGCHKCADENADDKTQRFHKLVALMLSSQTKDETTYHAMLRLREHTLTPESIINMKPNVLENILHPVSFYKNKAKYLQQTSKVLIEKYNSDIPDNIKDLVALPGVGPKMAHICMATAWHQTTGIGVDVHVHRICNRLQWVQRTTKEPEQTRVALETWLPRDLWKEVNHLLVGFGQTTCTPVKPKCSECLNCNICPEASKIKPKKLEVKKENAEVSNLCDKATYRKKKMHL